MFYNSCHDLKLHPKYPGHFGKLIRLPRSSTAAMSDKVVRSQPPSDYSYILYFSAHVSESFFWHVTTYQLVTGTTNKPTLTIVVMIL